MDVLAEDMKIRVMVEAPLALPEWGAGMIPARNVLTSTVITHDGYWSMDKTKIGGLAIGVL